MKLLSYQPQNPVLPVSNQLTVVGAEPAEAPMIIRANTVEGDLESIRINHIVPTYRSGEPLISHVEFAEIAEEAIREIFLYEKVDSPVVRLSHPVYGRRSESLGKPAGELLDSDRTTYFERMMFQLTVSSVSDTIAGQKVHLSVMGTRVYDALSLRPGSMQRFQVAIGFQVLCCLNQKVSTDGLLLDIKVISLSHLKQSIRELLVNFDPVSQLADMEVLQHFRLSQSQFAHLIGKTRLYQYLPAKNKSDLPDFHFTESQVNAICKEYFTCSNFGGGASGEISLWKLYNLLTSANKSSYIDQFLSRGANASSFVNGVALALRQGRSHWFLD